MKTVLVCGGRTWGVCKDVKDLAAFQKAIGEQVALFEFLNAHVPQDALIIHGGAMGADYYAGQWAVRTGREMRVFKANWHAHQKAAGPIRNQRMLEEGKPDFVIAAPGGNGTADMVRRARGAGLPILYVPDPQMTTWRFFSET